MHNTKVIPRLLEAGEVERFHAVPSIPAQTVAAHSWGVTIIAMQIIGPEELNGYHNASTVVRLMKACLLHDTGELFTGDIPFTAKRGVFKDIKPQLDAAEAKVMGEMLWPMPELSPRLETILKLSDMMEGLRWANLYERTPYGLGPVIPDRWWHSLNDMFCSEQMNALHPEEAERAYQVFRVLSPVIHHHRIHGDFESLKRAVQYATKGKR